MFPTAEKIITWDDTLLKKVYNLLFIENVNPQITETREETDEYMMMVESEFKKRKLTL